MKKSVWLALGLAVFPLAMISMSGSPRNRSANAPAAIAAKNPTSATSISAIPVESQRVRLQKAADLAALYLARACQSDGEFVYRVNLNPKVAVAERYNEVRHAGAMFALASHYRARPNPQVKAALLRAGAFLRNRCLFAVPGRPDLLAVWSPQKAKPTLPNLQNEKAKLGGAGLALVALVQLEAVQPGATPLADLRKLARFIVFLQRKDGSFQSIYVPKLGKKQSAWISLYYPGEAALGLLMLYERDRAPLWAERAALTMAFLARSRRGQSDVPADHWALLATARLLPIYPRLQAPLPRAQIVAHAAQICESIARGAPNNGNDLWRGSLAPEGRTTPTATRLEGLLAALTFLPAAPGDLRTRQLRARLKPLILDGIEFLLRAQIRSGEFRGAMPRTILAQKSGKLDFSNSDSRDGEVRIDYVQHALSAWLQQLEFSKPSR